MSETDVILTGLPRSGTTLTCALLNKLPDTVALHEPMQGLELGDVSQPREIALDVRSFFQEQRRSIRESGVARSRNIEGAVPDNPFGTELSARGARRQVDVLGEIAIDKPLTDSFLLVIKHTSRFAPMIEELSEYFPVFALIRNPLAALASWGTVSTGIRRGRAGPAGRIDSELGTRVEQHDNELDRQIALLDWYYEQFSRKLPARSVIHYEDLVETGGRALSVMTPAADGLNEPLESRNLNALYGSERMRELGEELLKRDGAFWEFYPRSSVEALINASLETTDR